MLDADFDDDYHEYHTFQEDVQDPYSDPVVSFNTVLLNSARTTPCSDDDIFISDSDSEDRATGPAKARGRRRRRREAPGNIYDVLVEGESGGEDSEAESEEEGDGEEEEHREKSRNTENMSNAEKKRLKKEKKKAKERAENLKKISQLKDEGEEQLTCGDHARAVHSLAAAIALCGPDNPQPGLHHLLAGALALRGSWGAAAREHRRVLQLEPGHRGSARGLVNCCLVLGRLVEATAGLEGTREQGELAKRLKAAVRGEEEAAELRSRGEYEAAARRYGEVVQVCSRSSRLKCMQALCLALQVRFTEGF